MFLIQTVSCTLSPLNQDLDKLLAVDSIGKTIGSLQTILPNIVGSLVFMTLIIICTPKDSFTTGMVSVSYTPIYSFFVCLLFCLHSTLLYVGNFFLLWKSTRSICDDIRCLFVSRVFEKAHVFRLKYMHGIDF